jgi:hypothetical protein
LCGTTLSGTISLSFTLQFHLAAGKDVDLKEVLLKLASTDNKHQDELPFLERLLEEVQSKLEEGEACLYLIHLLVYSMTYITWKQAKHIAPTYEHSIYQRL